MIGRELIVGQAGRALHTQVQEAQSEWKRIEKKEEGVCRNRSSRTSGPACQ